MTTSLLHQYFGRQRFLSSGSAKYLIKYLIKSPVVHQNWDKVGSMMRLEEVKSAPPEARSAGWVPAGVVESELPQVHTAQADFSLAVERYGSESVLVLGGELDLFRATAIEDALAEVRHLTAVDLRMVTFIDVTTLGLLLDASRRRRAHGGELLVLVGAQTPMTAFHATGFDRLLAVTRLNDARRRIAPCTTSERTGLGPPPHTTLDGRNTNGNNGSN